MKRLRSNIKHVSRLALFALAVQFALSFGHFHGVAAEAASVAQLGLALSEYRAARNLAAPIAQNLSTPQPASDHGSGEHPGDICAICIVMAMANAALFATPSVVLPRAVDFSYGTAAAEFVRVASVRAGFQPRAPPIS
jgi:hypothetical protein